MRPLSAVDLEKRALRAIACGDDAKAIRLMQAATEAHVREARARDARTAHRGLPAEQKEAPFRSNFSGTGNTGTENR